MTDVHSPEVRSRNMAAIRGKDTKPELIVRRELHADGFRYKLHDRSLPGKPDLVFPKYRAVVFVHGCFWHGHDCPYFHLPATRTDFWKEKIGRTKKLDAERMSALLEDGWRVGEVWECALRGRNKLILGQVIRSLEDWLVGAKRCVVIRGKTN